MKSLLRQEFVVARDELTKAATAVDTFRPRDAERHLHEARCVIEVLVELLGGLPDAVPQAKSAKQAKRRRMSLRVHRVDYRIHARQ
jgi:hypothetical protein